MQQCSVVSRCGRFDISAAANRAKELGAQQERIRFTLTERSQSSAAPSVAGVTFFCALSDAGLQQCAANSGFRPEVPMLVKMIFSALAGASTTASFVVVTAADNPAMVQQHQQQLRSPASGSVVVLLFQLKGDFAPPESPVVAALAVPLQRVSGAAAVPPLPAAAAVTAAVAAPAPAAAAAPAAVAPPPAALAAPAASGGSDDVAALTRIMKETQQFLQQQREETHHRFERINAELKHRAAECAALRRDVDILKSTVAQARRSGSAGGGGGGGGAPTFGSGQRFPSPGGRPGSASRQPGAPYHQRSGSTGSSSGGYGGGGGGGGGPYRRTMTPPRAGNAPSGTAGRRFDSPNRPPGLLANRPAFGSTSARPGPGTPGRSRSQLYPVAHGTNSSHNHNDGSRGSLRSGGGGGGSNDNSLKSDRMYFGR